MKVRFSRESDADLVQIRAFIHADNPVRARTFALELVLAAVEIADSPLAFPLLGHRPMSDLRRKIHKGYVIIYRLQAETVEIVRILHGARDVERLTRPSEE